MSDTTPVPDHHVLVLAWLRPICQRLIMPDWLAITIGRWIFAWRPLDEAEMAHELAHVRQWRQHGFVRYIARYFGASSRAKGAGGDRYRDNEFEIEARAAEEAVRGRLG